MLSLLLLLLLSQSERKRGGDIAATIVAVAVGERREGRILLQPLSRWGEENGERGGYCCHYRHVTVGREEHTLIFNNNDDANIINYKIIILSNNHFE